jgi:hypothetical protein
MYPLKLTIMKTLKIILFVFTIFFSIDSLANEKISLSDAITNKYVTAKITGAGYINASASSHYGECIKIELINLSYTSYDIVLETGRKLVPVVDSVQTMMITKEMMISLLPKGTKTVFAYAMCTEKTDKSPNPKRKFKVGEMAEGKLLQLAKLIEKYDYQDNTAQQAVWVITNNSSLVNITSSDSMKVKILKGFLSEQPSTNFKNASGGTIEGKFTWNMDKLGTISIVVLNESGFEIGEIFSNKKYDKGAQSCNFKYTGCMIEPNKVYKVRLKIQDYTVDELACTSE